MARTPSRPGYLILGGLVFLVLPFIFHVFSGDQLERNWVIGGALISLLFFVTAYQSWQLRRNASVSRPQS